MKLIAILASAAFVLPALGQNTRRAEVFPGKDISAQISKLEETSRSSGSGGATLGDYKSHSVGLSVRRATGNAEVHAHFDDIFFVTGGTATLISGGTVVDAQTGADGETRGSRIQDGTSQKIARDDVVHIPAGTPHQLIISPGATFSAVVVKVKE